jgi:hypothetical protein
MTPLPDDPLPRIWTDPDHPDELLDAAYRSGIVPAAQQGLDDGWDNITILRARGRRLAKRIAADGSIESYDLAKRFDITALPVDGLDHLEEDLHRLLHQPDRCVVRGAIADLGRATHVRRLLHPDDRDPGSLVDIPRRWLALDVDSLALPDNVVVDDISACARVAIETLPAEFRDVRGVAQFTGSHGFKPGIRMRLWYWLDRPVCCPELKRWFAGVPVDHSLFGAAQVIYSAAPVFVGRCDPLQNRMVRLPGSPQVTVPEFPEPERPAAARLVKPDIGLSRYADVALDNAFRHIVGAREGERDKAINSEAFSIGRLAGAGAIPPSFALSVLHHATSKIAGYSNRDASKVQRSFDAGLRAPRGAPSHG